MVRYPDEFRKANLTDNVPKMYDCISNITETNHLIFLWKKKNSVVEKDKNAGGRQDWSPLPKDTTSS